MQKNNIILIIILIFTFILIFAFKVDGNPSCIGFQKTYELYKSQFMSEDGRIMDPVKNNITTSEGQSYIMLQSLAVDDEKTFNLAYKWAQNNLQRPDKLFSWLWGENQNGEYKILDENSASDSDVDIAFALILAYEKWNKPEYLLEGKSIINSIWNNETKRVGNHLILMPGVKQTNDKKIEINPSYFAPYAFRYFQKYDELHDWSCLIDSSYYYLDKVMKKTKTHLPPNWFLIENGEIVLENSMRSDFSYDAVRVYARIYLDYLENREKRALPILETSEFFIKQWTQYKRFYTNYKVNGELRDKTQYTGSIAVILPAINMNNPKIAKEIYNSKLKLEFESENYWSTKNDYYSKNLSWFGAYLYNNTSTKCKKWGNR